MSKVPFSVFNDAIQKQFALMVASGFPLVSLDTNSDVIWDTYLNSFPEGTNPIFRERREYDCNCCKNFVRRLGNVAALTPDGYMTIWDVEVAGYYNDVAKAMNKFVSQHTIRDIFVTSEPVAGSKPNKDGATDVTWTHFYVQVPKQFVKGKDEIGPYLANFRSSFQVFERAMTELKLDAFETVNELITQGSLYRGAEFKKTVADFLQVKKQYDPSKELLKVEISPFVDNKNKELCLQLIAHLRLQGIDCEYEYVPEYSGRHDYNPEYHYIVFKF